MKTTTTPKEGTMETQTTATKKTSKDNGTTAPAVAATGVRAKLLALRDELRDRFPEREHVITSLLVALVADVHAVLIGPPGTAKSLLVRTIAAAITDAVGFDWLMTRFTTPEEVFGPVSLSGLQHDRMTRVTKGKLPEANVAFLDETFKANSAILNALLTAMNERLFHDDGGAKRIPLYMLVGASNEMPQGDELEALYDRFIMRHVVEEVREYKSFAAITGGHVAPLTVSLTLAEVDAARAEADAIALPDDVRRALFNLRGVLASDGIKASDRRWVQLCAVLRANAWLDGATEVDSMHFDILRHALWREPKDAPKVASVIAKTANPKLAEATEIHDAAMELARALPPAPQAIGQRGPATLAELKKAVKKMESIGKELRGQTLKKVEGYVTGLAAEHDKIRERYMAEMGI